MSYRIFDNFQVRRKVVRLEDQFFQHGKQFLSTDGKRIYFGDLDIERLQSLRDVTNTLFGIDLNGRIWRSEYTKVDKFADYDIIGNVITIYLDDEDFDEFSKHVQSN